MTISVAKNKLSCPYCGGKNLMAINEIPVHPTDTEVECQDCTGRFIPVFFPPGWDTCRNF